MVRSDLFTSGYLGEFVEVTEFQICEHVLDIIRKNIFFGIIDFFFCILEMHV